LRRVRKSYGYVANTGYAQNISDLFDNSVACPTVIYFQVKSGKTAFGERVAPSRREPTVGEFDAVRRNVAPWDQVAGIRLPRCYRIDFCRNEPIFEFPTKSKPAASRAGEPGVADPNHLGD
jgi:hypothetical protein